MLARRLAGRERDIRRRLEDEEAAARAEESQRAQFAAVRVQAAGRGMLARRIVGREREHRQRLKETEAAAAVEEAQRTLHAAVRLQAAGRGMLARRRAKTRGTAARQLQHMGQCWCLRRRLLRREEAAKEVARLQLVLEYKAARSLQTAARGMLERRLRSKAASRIQAAVRGMAGRHLATAQRIRNAIPAAADNTATAMPVNEAEGEATEGCTPPSPFPFSFPFPFPSPPDAQPALQPRTSFSALVAAARPPRPPSTDPFLGTSSSRASSPVSAGLDDGLAPLVIPKGRLSLGKRVPQLPPTVGLRSDEQADPAPVESARGAVTQVNVSSVHEHFAALMTILFRANTLSLNAPGG